MTANQLTPDCAAEVVDFLSRNLPVADFGNGWSHMFSTAYQIGCEALVALGQAEETRWGAVPRKDHRFPTVLPRWDDICVAVLWLAHQRDKLVYHLPDGSLPPSNLAKLGWTVVGGPRIDPPVPNIAAAHGLGPARAQPEVLPVVDALGLVSEGCWTSAAETVLWRDQPQEWGMDVTSDPRFGAALERAVDTMPDDIHAEMDRLVMIDDADVAAALAQIVASHEEMRAKHGPNAQIVRPATTEIARKSLEFRRCNDLDWLFFRRWRLDDGWLTFDEAKRALEIFHDPLAWAMRRAVTVRLYPDVPFLAEGHPR